MLSFYLDQKIALVKSWKIKKKKKFKNFNEKFKKNI